MYIFFSEFMFKTCEFYDRMVAHVSIVKQLQKQAKNIFQKFSMVLRKYNKLVDKIWTAFVATYIHFDTYDLQFLPAKDVSITLLMILFSM